jgi:hypothetical protein
MHEGVHVTSKELQVHWSRAESARTTVGSRCTLESCNGASERHRGLGVQPRAPAPEDAVWQHPGPQSRASVAGWNGMHAPRRLPWNECTPGE